MMRNVLSILAGCLGLVLPLCANSVALVDAALPAFVSSDQLMGHLSSVGDPALKALMNAWMASFQRFQPGVSKGPVWQHENADAAVGALMFETADVAPLARELLPSETAPYAHQFAGDMMKTPLMIRVAGGRNAWLAVNKRPGSPLPNCLLAFLSFALSREGQAIVAADAAFAPLSAAEAATERLKLEGYVANLDFDLRHYVTVPGVRGSFSSVGSDGMKTLMDRWMRDFEKLQPGVHKGERWEHLGTLNGFHALIGNQTDIAPMGRELWPEERAIYGAVQHHDVLEIRVARGGYDTPQRTTAQAIFVHSGNPLGQITFSQLTGILASPPTITRWGQLGLEGEWANRPIEIHMPPHIAPNAMWMQAAVLHGAAWNQGAHEASIPETARGLANDVNGIGFGGFEEGGPGLKALAVSAGDSGPFVDGNAVSASNGVYPLTRYMFIRINRRPGEPLPPAIKQFLRYVLSREGQDPVRYSGYFPLGGRVAREELAKLE